MWASSDHLGLHSSAKPNVKLDDQVSINFKFKRSPCPVQEDNPDAPPFWPVVGFTGLLLRNLN